MLDLLIKDGKIIDGCGNPCFQADIGVQGDKIVQVRHAIHGEANRVIYAVGLIVSPGFINTHTHSGLRVFKHSEDDSKRMQGITPALIGQAKSSAGNNPLIAVINGEVSLNSS